MRVILSSHALAKDRNHPELAENFYNTSYLDTKINIGKGTEGIKTSIYDKREDFIFGIINFDSNIPKNPQDLMKPKPIIVELHTI